MHEAPRPENKPTNQRLVPTLCVGTPSSTLRVAEGPTTATIAWNFRTRSVRQLRSHAERGNEKYQDQKPKTMRHSIFAFLGILLVVSSARAGNEPDKLDWKPWR